MMEKNKDILQKAIRNLPIYDPPADIWNTVDRELDAHEQLQSAVEKLPIYNPPPQVWNAIASDLQETAKEDGQSAKVRTMPTYRWLAIAATIALLLTAGWFYMNNSEQASIEIVTSEEIHNPELLEADWEEDEKAIQEVAQLFVQSDIAKTEDNYQDLLQEFEELETAREEVQNIMKQYGKDPGLVRQIAEIEIDRTEIVKQMAALI